MRDVRFVEKKKENDLICSEVEVIHFSYTVNGIDVDSRNFW